MTDESPDFRDDLPAEPEASVPKKSARKRAAAPKASKAEEESEPAAAEDGGQESRPAAPPPSAPDSTAKVTVDERNGIETREIESPNARRVSSKPLRSNREPSEPGATTDSREDQAKRGDRNGGGHRIEKDEDSESRDPAAEEGGIPVITEPPGGDESGGKRRRRRRRKGGGDEPEPTEVAARPQRASLDSKALASKAWKIYKAEVAEEGLALISDGDARELSRRSFRLAEIFLEEASRRQ